MCVWGHSRDDVLPITLIALYGQVQPLLMQHTLTQVSRGHVLGVFSQQCFWERQLRLFIPIFCRVRFVLQGRHVILFCLCLHSVKLDTLRFMFGSKTNFLNTSSRFLVCFDLTVVGYTLYCKMIKCILGYKLLHFVLWLILYLVRLNFTCRSQPYQLWQCIKFKTYLQ